MVQASRRKFHMVYQVTRITDSAFYIGLHSTDNLDDGYFGSGQRLWHSIKKHGKDAHSFTILHLLPSRQEAIAKERELVTRESLQNPLCLNLCVGGCATPNEPSLTARERMSKSAVKRGPRLQSADERAKRSATMKGKPKNRESVAKSVASKRVNLTDATREKLGCGNRGKSQSTDANAKRSKTLRQTNAAKTTEQRALESERKRALWTPARRAAAAARMRKN
jgi:hypothetical protein